MFVAFPGVYNERHIVQCRLVMLASRTHAPAAARHLCQVIVVEVLDFEVYVEGCAAAKSGKQAAHPNCLLHQSYEYRIMCFHNL